MDKITQTALYGQYLICYAQKYGVTKAAIRYRTNRQYIYRWRNRYDGTLASLEDRSHRPHSHPNQHRPDEIKLIQDMRRRNPNTDLAGFLGQAETTVPYPLTSEPILRHAKAGHATTGELHPQTL